MFLHGFFQKKQIRQFGFTPFYYKEDADGETEETEPRIKFRKILRGVEAKKKPVRGMIFLVILLLFCLFYLLGLVSDETRRFQLEDIRIEETPQ